MYAGSVGAAVPAAMRAAYPSGELERTDDGVHRGSGDVQDERER